MNKITRSTVNEQQYSAPEIQTSGFPLSYRRYTSAALGRIHVGGFHWTMPGDKISGKTTGTMTFERIVTPIVSPVNAMQYNIFLPIRPLDRSFKKGITPTKNNAMSANWSMPTVNTRYLVEQLLFAYFNEPYNSTEVQSIEELLTYFYVNPTHTLAQAISGGTLSGISSMNDFMGVFIGTPINSLTDPSGFLRIQSAYLYKEDALLDIADNITAKLGSQSNPLSGSMLISDFLNLYFSVLLQPWVGRYSYYAELKYNYLRPFDFYRISRQLTSASTVTRWQDFIDIFDDTPLNEYPLRAMYAVWYELFRNVDLEPVRNNLPDWQEWSSTSIFDMSAGGNLCFLLWHIRSWEKDMFISSQIDDLCRHVYAPIYGSSDKMVAGRTDFINLHDANTQSDPIAPDNEAIAGTKPSIYKLNYRDQLSDTDISIACPVPSNINDVISQLDNSFIDVYGLDLNTLRQSQMLERYLKRNYLFGDEYQDRMLAHYNSRVSDMRINKPEILSQSMDGYDMQQQVSNVSTSAGSSVGDRTATATVKVNGNEYTTFCEEFGIVLSLVCFMPRAMYDGVCPQLLMSKQIHMPIPEFAANNEEFGRKIEIAASGLAPIGNSDTDDNRFIFGRYPAYHAWRSRVDEVGGKFLDEMQDCTFRRFFGMFSEETTPKLNYFFIHCRPNLNMFASPLLYDMQLYGDLVHECYVERVLPTPVEVI